MLFTIGHGDLPIDELLRNLDAHHVRTVLDVRSQPHSSHAPQYNKHELEAELVAAGISYRWLGNHLGGRPLRPGEPVPIDDPGVGLEDVGSIGLLGAGPRRVVFDGCIVPQERIFEIDALREGSVELTPVAGETTADTLRLAIGDHLAIVRGAGTYLTERARDHGIDQ